MAQNTETGLLSLIQLPPPPPELYGVSAFLPPCLASLCPAEGSLGLSREARCQENEASGEEGGGGREGAEATLQETSAPAGSLRLLQCECTDKDLVQAPTPLTQLRLSQLFQHPPSPTP